VSGFSPDWLALRQPADARARNHALAERLVAHVARRRVLRIVDIGAGSGNNMVSTAPLLSPVQHWVLVDADEALLLDAMARVPHRATAEARVLDLSDPDALAPILAMKPDLVTASAFFDLCGGAWIERFADLVAAARAAVYVVLNYDGREEWSPASPLDATALAAFHADQRRDKGLGPALGPDAHGRLAGALRARGYRVEEAESDWRLEAPRDAQLIDELARGSAAAIRPHLGSDRTANWLAARRSVTRVLIGHRDMLATPPR
jgi:hypothetical protein